MARIRRALGVLAAFCWGVQSAARPPNAVNLTLYHVGPDWFPPLPLNQNSADWMGHLTFSFMSGLDRYECNINATQEYCRNPEVFTPISQLVVTKLLLEVDSRFETYGQCNVCVAGHVQHHPDVPCRNGDYACSCVETSSGPVDTGGNLGCGSGVGREFVANTSFGPCGPQTADTQCWFVNSAHKLGGQWFSTLAEGLCDSPTSLRCAWRLVAVVERLPYACIEASVQSAVEATDPHCFRRCSSRGFTSLCYIRCFYRALLGPQADREPTFTGLPVDVISDIWHRPWKPPEQGGCPRLPLPPQYPSTPV
jgi:hypothetical protein